MDKVLHGVVCMFATAVTGAVLFFMGEAASIVAGALFALGLGIGKEVGDHLATGNRWDWRDILADVIGIALGVLSLLLAWRD